MVYLCDLNTKEIEAGESEFKAIFNYLELKASLGYPTPHETVSKTNKDNFTNIKKL